MENDSKGRILNGRIHIIGIVLALAAILFAGCGDPGTGGPAGLEVSVRAGFPNPVSTMSLSAGTLADVESVTVEVRESISGAVVYPSTTMLGTPGTADWSLTLDGLPSGISLDFNGAAYDGTGVAIFLGTLTQTLAAGGPTALSLPMVSVDDGVTPVLPVLTSVSLADNIATSSIDNQIAVNISHTGVVNYSITVSAGSLDNSWDGAALGLATLSGAGHDPTPWADLLVYFSAPAVANVESLTLTLWDPAYPDYRMSATYPVPIVEGPAITGLVFNRTATTLEVTANVTAGGADTTGIVMTGSGSGTLDRMLINGAITVPAGTSGSSSPLVIDGFSDTDAGDLTITVIDENGIEAATIRIILAGEFPAP